jgi:amino-acid N-acetyltransferase
MHVYFQPPEDAAKSLLASCNLPIADLEAKHFERFFGCGSESSPAGVVGLELYGNAALLRSLAVSEVARGQGCGKRLVSEAEAYAKANGVNSIYLLTTSAETFFQSLGYSVANRSAVPEAIRGTQQFSGLCPSSASLMVKHIGS